MGVAFYAVVLATPQELSKIRGDALATIAYVANWRPVFTGQSYFDQFSIPSPLLHTWSLGIEEQYYAVWPLLLLLVAQDPQDHPGQADGRGRYVLAAASALLMALLFHPDDRPLAGLLRHRHEGAVATYRAPRWRPPPAPGADKERTCRAPPAGGRRRQLLR